MNRFRFYAHCAEGNNHEFHEGVEDRRLASHAVGRRGWPACEERLATVAEADAHRVSGANHHVTDER